VRHDDGFNFSRQSNLGAAAAVGDHLLFLNDDIVPVSPDWLHRLIEGFLDPSVGVIGPLLLYPDESVQHAGIYLGYKDGAGHTLRHAKIPDEDYLFMAAAPRLVSAVTGAALLVRRKVFQALNGFDELLPSYLQDVDLCLRLRGAGQQVAFDPRAILLHLESASMADTLGEPDAIARRTGELARFRRRWPHLVELEPFHNPLFDLGSQGLRDLVGA
jgi:GT2 family glycosyltransferase